MKQNLLLTITSLLSILFMTFHLAGDSVLGFENGGASNLIAVPILVVWLYGAVVLAGRRSGYVIILLGSLLGLLVPVLHMTGKGVGGEIAQSSQIGAVKAADLLDLAVSLFPFDDPHSFPVKRNQYMDSLDESAELFVIGDQVCGDETIWQQLESYISGHPAMFNLSSNS